MSVSNVLILAYCDVLGCSQQIYLSSFVQKAKSGLDLAKGWLFTLVIQDTNIIVDLKVLITGKT